MIYVLVVITIFTSASGAASDTRFHEFDGKAACETARDGIVRALGALKGTMGREVIAACYPKGEPGR